MNISEVRHIKQRINRSVSKRDGNSGISVYANKEYDLPSINIGDPVSAEVGQKTIGILSDTFQGFPELGSTPVSGQAIPASFNQKDIERICDILDKDEKTRGGNITYSQGKKQYTPETNHCNASCAGLCYGDCTGACNGCTGCSSLCNSGCTSACKADCTSVCRSSNTGSTVIGPSISFGSIYTSAEW